MTIRKQSQTIFTSTARAATVVSAVFSAEEVINSTFIFDVTAVSATPSVVPTIEGKDQLSGSFYTVATGAAITATGTTTLQIGKDLEIVASEAASDFLPKEYRVTMTHADGDSITYTVGANHMVDI